MNLKIFLNGDGMTNVHPRRDTVNNGKYYTCEMSQDDFEAYLIENDLEVVSFDVIADKEDGYVYGYLKNSQEVA